MSQPVIFWFRQDLRLADNPALTAAAGAGQLIAVYILDDETPGVWRWGGASRWWLHQGIGRAQTHERLTVCTVARRRPLVHARPLDM